MTTPKIQIPNVPTTDPLIYRTYSRKRNSISETLQEIWDRVYVGLCKLGNYNDYEKTIILKNFYKGHSYPSGRYLWVGGTEWSEHPKNYGGLYNCFALRIEGWEDITRSFARLMEGCGAGATYELSDIKNLNRKYPLDNVVTFDEFFVTKKEDVGIFYKPEDEGVEHTRSTRYADDSLYIVVGDSRDGWVDALLYLLAYVRPRGLRPDRTKSSHIAKVFIDLRHVRPAGQPIKGFGGVSNPGYLSEMFLNIGNLLKKYFNKEIDAYFVEKLLNEPACATVAGNVRRSARISLASASDEVFLSLKQNMWTCDENGDWKIDPDKNSMRMANHTRIYHHIPSYQDWVESLTNQFNTSEGALQFAPMAILRCNRDYLTEEKEDTYKRFLLLHDVSNETFVPAYTYLTEILTVAGVDSKEIDFRLKSNNMNPCGEIISGTGFMCNLGEVQLNTLYYKSDEEIAEAFKAASLMVLPLLKHEFVDRKLQYAREVDPIVGISLTGLFDFFVKKFGFMYLVWWQLGRPEYLPGSSFEDYKTLEGEYLKSWKNIVKEQVESYCERENIPVPRRYTTIKPSGSLSLISGASPGWHPPKYWQYVRRMTFRAYDPVALVCLDKGYRGVPSVSCKDEDGKLLNDIYDPRVDEWLIEIPIRVDYYDLVKQTSKYLKNNYNPNTSDCDPNNYSALAQLDFYGLVNKEYSNHTTSATVEFRESEIEAMAKYMVDNLLDMEYVSFASTARFDANQTMPRLPYEPITDEDYEDRVSNLNSDLDFYKLLCEYNQESGINFDGSNDRGSVGCDSQKCML